MGLVSADHERYLTQFLASSAAGRPRTAEAEPVSLRGLLLHNNFAENVGMRAHRREIKKQQVRLGLNDFHTN